MTAKQWNRLAVALAVASIAFDAFGPLIVGITLFAAATYAAGRADGLKSYASAVMTSRRSTHPTGTLGVSGSRQE